jgi:tetratricopeptide (TPR) repeat protein/transcriptional regulator with XRE-family HTH domain
MESPPPKPNVLLKQARLEHGLSQAELAREVDVSLKQVWRWEKGQATPYPCHRQRLCTLFHKTAEELGLDPEDSSSPPTECMDECLPLLDQLPSLSSHILVGRDQDRAALRQLLLGGASVVVVGLPGVGKTALVLTLAYDATLRRHFQDRILWAGLGRNPNVSEILNAWGQALGVSSHHVAKKGKAALQAAIGNRPICFLLDDVWESGDAMQFHIGGLQCSYVYTSRFPRVAAELSGGPCLSYPLRELNEEQSMHLLHVLAPRAVEMEPEKTSELASAVGGLPLALNLVGRSLNLQSMTGQVRRVQAALERLSDARERFQLPVAPLSSALLQPGTAAVLSLASIIATSEDVLDEQARSALYALSILPTKPASFSEAAALAVAHCSPETLDLLCDLGFLECDGPDGYHMHQVIADYGRDHLETESRTTAFSRLIAYVLELLETSADDYPRLDEEIPTILAALETVSVQNMRHELIQMIGVVTPFLMLRVQPALAERYLQHACHLTKQAQDDTPLPKLLWLLGNVFLMLDRLHEAAAAYQEGIRVARALHDEENLCKLLADLGWQMHLFGLADQAETYMHEGMALASQLGLKEQLVVLYKIQGSVAWMQGNYAQAEEAYRQGLRLLEQLDPCRRKDLGSYYCFLGWIAGVQGKYEQAEECFQRSIEATDHYTPDVSAFMWGMRCTIQVLYRPETTIRENLERVVQRTQECGVGYCMYVYKALALLELALGNTERAEQEAQRGLAIAQQVQAKHQPGELLTVLATIALKRGEVEQAARLLERAFPLVRATSSAEERATTIAAWGEVLLQRQHLEEAEQAFQETLQTAPHEHKPLVALARYGLARVAAGRGEVSEALRQGRLAFQLFASLDHIKVPEVRNWLYSLQESLDQKKAPEVLDVTSPSFARKRKLHPERSGPQASASA